MSSCSYPFFIRTFPLCRLVLITFSVLLVWMCLPSGPAVWLPFIAITPFVLALGGVRPLSGFLWGWFFGTSIWLVSTWWIFYGCKNLIQLPWSGAVIGTLLFCLFQGLPYGLQGLVSGGLEQRGRTPGVFFCASLLTLLCYFRPAVCPGSPALALYSWPLAIQIADIGGVNLVLFVVFLCNWQLAKILRQGFSKGIMSRLAGLIVVLVLIFGYGAWRMKSFAHMQKKAGAQDYLTITSIQPNLPIRHVLEVNGSGPAEGAVERLIFETDQANIHFASPDLVVWPEIPVTLSCACENFTTLGIGTASGRADAPILVTGVEYFYGSNTPVTETYSTPSGATITVSSRALADKFNAVWVAREDGCERGYRKMKLVPFGERTPFQKTWPWLKKHLGHEVEYSPGKELALITLANGKRVQPLICFESGFSSLTRRGVLMGAAALVNVSDDAWFVAPKASELHLAMALFRTVETRRPMVSCTNSGFGGHVTALGNIVPGSLTPMYEQTARQAALYCPETTTLYTRMGDYWLWLPGIYVLGCLLLPERRRTVDNFSTLFRA